MTFFKKNKCHKLEFICGFCTIEVRMSTLKILILISLLKSISCLESQNQTSQIPIDDINFDNDDIVKIIQNTVYSLEGIYVQFIISRNYKIHKPQLKKSTFKDVKITKSDLFCRNVGS